MVGICCDHSRLTDLPDHPAQMGSAARILPGSSSATSCATTPSGCCVSSVSCWLVARCRWDCRARRSTAWRRLRRCRRRISSLRPQSALGSTGICRKRLILGFAYQAVWQETEQRIEMALVSRCEQSIELAGETWTFQAHERLITEHSLKYSPAHRSGSAAGWRIQRRSHRADSFSLHRLEPADRDRLGGAS